MANRTVPSTGPRDSPLIAIVGEAPGADEERLGVPFIGASGQLLTSMLSAAGIDRSSCYITNVLPTRPPNNDFGVHYVDKKRTHPTDELRAAWTALRQDLRLVNPKITVALGGEALRALTDHTSITTYRGTICSGPGGLRVLPSLHPAFVLRGNYQDRAVVECDLRKAKRLALTPHTPRTRFITEPSFEETLHYLRLPHDTIAYDIETTRNHVRLFGFAWSHEDAISIPFSRGQTHRWTEEQECEVLTALRNMLENPDIKKVVQNGMYDNTILAREFGIDVRPVTHDTMLAQHLLYPELLKGLDFISSIYTDHPMYWGEGTGPEYNCYDCVVTWEAHKHQCDELRERNMLEYFHSIPMRALRALCYIQSRGVLINQQARAEIRSEAVARLEQYRSELLALGCTANPLSPKKVMEYLYDQLKLPTQYKGRGVTKKRTSDDDALRALSRKSPAHSPVLDRLVSFRQTNTLISTFIDQELLNGRSVTSYNVAGTVTGRLASSSTIDRLGGNLQNIPRGSFRRIFVADPGKVLIKADLSQAEYRVLIWKARISRVIQRWTTDPTFNIHKWNASENIYRVPIDQVTKVMYDNAKSGVYGANYGIGPPKVSRMYNIPLKDAEFIIRRYHEAVPEIKGVYQREIEDELRRTGAILNPLGRERVFLGRLDDDTFRQAYSHYCQSTVGDLINLALIELTDLGVEVLLQVHDELVCQCDEDDLPRTLGLIRMCMERPINISGVDVPLKIPCGIKVGPDWYNMKEAAA